MLPNIKGIVVLSFIIVIGLVACGGGDSSSGGGKTVADASQVQAGEDGADPGGNDGPDGSGGADQPCEYTLNLLCGSYDPAPFEYSVVFGDGYCSKTELEWSDFVEKTLAGPFDYLNNTEEDIDLWTEYASYDIDNGCPEGSG